MYCQRAQLSETGIDAELERLGVVAGVVCVDASLLAAFEISCVSGEDHGG